MALIQCEDCGREISDLAPACIHCGRPRRAGSTDHDFAAASAGRFAHLKRASQGALERSGAAVRTWLASLQEGASDLVHDASARVGTLTSAAIERLIESRPVEAVVLPLGSRPTEFQVLLDLSDVLDDLSAGILVRPKLQVWAHRVDIAPDGLASALEQSFSRQVSEFRTARQVVADRKAADAASRALIEQKEAKRTGRAARKGALAAGLAMLLVTNPLLDLALLLIAVTAGASAVIEALRESHANLETAEAEKEREKVGAAIRAKRAAFRVALKNLSVQVHPSLHRLAEDFAALDDAALIPNEVPEPPYPDVLGAMTSLKYRLALPSWYQPLLDARLDDERQRAGASA